MSQFGTVNTVIAQSRSAVPHSASAFTLDGVFDEAVWKRARPANDFIQVDPSNGAGRFVTLDQKFASKVLYTHRF